MLYYKYSDDSKTAALEAAVSRIRANLASRSIEAAEAAVGERIPRAKTIAVVEDFYRRANPDKVPNAAGWIIDYYEGCELCGNQIYGAFDLNRRVDLHAIDATPARWRGDVGSSPLDTQAGNTGGLGGAFGYFWGTGNPLPFPECQPFKGSIQLRLLGALQKLMPKD